MITVETEGVACRFDVNGIDPSSPGIIAGALFNGSFYEQRMLTYIRSLGMRGVYVDVGASIGNHTVYFAKLCDAELVYAFEPLEHNFQRLERNIALNELEQRVVARKVAVTDTKGELKLELGRFSEVVPADLLDDLVRVPRVSVIKIDVEGMEPHVLRGARRILVSHRPRIFAEAHTDDERRKLAALLRPLLYQPTGRVFNATPTYEFAPIPPRTARDRAYLLALRVAYSSAGRRIRAVVPPRVRRAFMRLLRG